jgi:hypothetical protein
MDQDIITLLERVREKRHAWRFGDTFGDDERYEEYAKAKKEYMRFCEYAVYDERGEDEQPRDTFGLGKLEEAHAEW